jgi:hypothetical protein
MKSRSGGGLLLLRRKTPLTRRSVAYFHSGAHIRDTEREDSAACTGLGPNSLPSNATTTLHSLQQ